jgi:sugar diacid utilization regulator/putative methionine-R-sulfoxide reductase with GAF domain
VAKSQYDPPVATAAAPANESRILHEIISTASSSLDLDEVLKAVVRLLSDASAVHACFVYLVDAGEPYGQYVGRIALERGEGLAWWVAERKKPAFIRDNLLADSRVKHVPELDEERFQSLVSVPILGKDRTLIGVISMHTEAPREFTEDEVEFLVSSASLVAGAIENARLYEETLDDLLPAVASRSRELLRADACRLYLLDPSSEQLRLRASAPPGAEARAAIPLTELGPELSRRGQVVRVAIPLVASDELLGVLQAQGTAEVDLARAVANQTAVAIKKIELIERLTEKNLIKDFFEQLAGGKVLGELEGRAARLGCDLDQAYLVIAASPADDRFEKALRSVASGSLFDRRDDSMRALLRVPAGGEPRLLETLRGVQSELGGSVAIGVSNVCTGAASFPAGFEEARHALLGTTVLLAQPSVMTYDELGPYKYLLPMSLDGAVRDSHQEAVARLAAYDRERSTSLFRTLEEFLHRRGNISASAEALFVHPNTLRQRLRRIMEISELDLRRDDWLMVEIAVKLVKLQEALGTAPLDISGPPRL